MYLLLGSHTALSHFAECLGGLNRWSSLLSACAGHLKALVYVQTEDGFSPLSLGHSPALTSASSECKSRLILFLSLFLLVLLPCPSLPPLHPLPLRQLCYLS